MAYETYFQMTLEESVCIPDPYVHAYVLTQMHMYTDTCHTKNREKIERTRKQSGKVFKKGTPSKGFIDVLCTTVIVATFW